MSKVISFRLNPDNPMEAEALRVLEEKQAQGLSYRRVLCEALLSMRDVMSPYSSSLEDINMTLEKFNELIDRLVYCDRGNAYIRSADTKQIALNEDFIHSVKFAARIGMKLD